MKKFLPISLILLLLILTGCNNENSQNNNTYNVSRTAVQNNNNNSNMVSNTVNQITENNVNPEVELSSFSTKIYTPNDEERQNNIRITCSKLDGTIVKPRRNIFFL